MFYLFSIFFFTYTYLEKAVNPTIQSNFQRKIQIVTPTAYPIYDSLLTNRRDAASLLYRNCAETTVFCVNRSRMCAGSKLSGIVGT